VSSSKLIPAHDLAVCTILDAVVRQSIKKRKFTPNGLRVMTGVGGNEEAETVDDNDDEAVIEDAIDVQSDAEPDATVIIDYGPALVRK
jgi:hypothetical protein